MEICCEGLACIYDRAFGAQSDGMVSDKSLPVFGYIGSWWAVDKKSQRSSSFGILVLMMVYSVSSLSLVPVDSFGKSSQDDGC